MDCKYILESHYNLKKKGNGDSCKDIFSKADPFKYCSALKPKAKTGQWGKTTKSHL